MIQNTFLFFNNKKLQHVTIIALWPAKAHSGSLDGHFACSIICHFSVCSTPGQKKTEPNGSVFFPVINKRFF
jgi:hypothetical protein